MQYYRDIPVKDSQPESIPGAFYKITGIFKVTGKFVKVKWKTEELFQTEGDKIEWQLNATCDLELVPSAIKYLIGITDKTWTESKG